MEGQQELLGVGKKLRKICLTAGQLKGPIGMQCLDVPVLYLGRERTEDSHLPLL